MDCSSRKPFSVSACNGPITRKSHNSKGNSNRAKGASPTRAIPITSQFFRMVVEAIWLTDLFPSSPERGRRLTASLGCLAGADLWREAAVSLGWAQPDRATTTRSNNEVTRSLHRKVLLAWAFTSERESNPHYQLGNLSTHRSQDR